MQFVTIDEVWRGVCTDTNNLYSNYKCSHIEIATRVFVIVFIAIVGVVKKAVVIHETEVGHEFDTDDLY